MLKVRKDNSSLLVILYNSYMYHALLLINAAVSHIYLFYSDAMCDKAQCESFFEPGMLQNMPHYYIPRKRIYSLLSLLLISYLSLQKLKDYFNHPMVISVEV